MLLPRLRALLLAIPVVLTLTADAQDAAQPVEQSDIASATTSGPAVSSVSSKATEPSVASPWTTTEGVSASSPSAVSYPGAASISYLPTPASEVTATSVTLGPDSASDDESDLKSLGWKCIYSPVDSLYELYVSEDEDARYWVAIPKVNDTSGIKIPLIFLVEQKNAGSEDDTAVVLIQGGDHLWPYLAERHGLDTTDPDTQARNSFVIVGKDEFEKLRRAHYMENLTLVDLLRSNLDPSSLDHPLIEREEATETTTEPTTASLTSPTPSYSYPSYSPTTASPLTPTNINYPSLLSAASHIASAFSSRSLLAAGSAAAEHFALPTLLPAEPPRTKHKGWGWNALDSDLPPVSTSVGLGAEGGARVLSESFYETLMREKKEKELGLPRGALIGHPRPFEGDDGED